jgi:hypothetical protein
MYGLSPELIKIRDASAVALVNAISMTKATIRVVNQWFAHRYIDAEMSPSKTTFSPVDRDCLVSDFLGLKPDHR